MTIPADYVSELRKHFEGDVRLDATTRILYSTDASIYQMEPLGVVIPRTQEDLIAAVELASKYKIPILPRGSGSSLAGQAIGHALIIDCSRHLDHIVSEIDMESSTVTVEPGVILGNLNRIAGKQGLMYGPDPASAERATMGGVIGNNATGAHSIIFGMTADNILSAEVILSDGSLATWGPVMESEVGSSGIQSNIMNTALSIRNKFPDSIVDLWPKTWRNSAGYRLNYLLPWSATRPHQWQDVIYPPTFGLSMFNLASLLAGSEGTLAVIRAAQVRLVPKPKHTILGVLSYESLSAACDAVPDMLKFNPSAVELIPKMLINLARSIPIYAGQLGFVVGNPEALLVVEFSGSDFKTLRQKASQLRHDVIIAESQEDQARVWAVRKAGLGIFDSNPTSKRPVAFIEDCAIPVEKLGEFVREVEKILDNHSSKAAFYAHASAGCLHIRPILDLQTGEGVRNLRSIAEDVLRLALNLGGSMSSEHGDGLVRSEWLKQTYGEDILNSMKSLKKAADPDFILNPGKIIDAPNMDTNLRYGAAYLSKAWEPALDFSHQNSLTSAIEQCNGQGVCRKSDGVMCPSFQATRDEMFSTRGRANLLRALIGVGQASLPEESVKLALDLCLACKGCKAECPSKVDMAKLKYEFQAHYYKNHNRQIRDYLFANIGQFTQFISPFKSIFNWVTDEPITQGLLSKLLHISSERSLPKIERNPFRNYESKILNRNNLKFSETCLLLPDTFTHFYEPEIEESAMKVLRACGIGVKRLGIFGAGRTLISKGFIDPARRHAQKLLDEIRRQDPAGKMAIVGLEPSEIYTLRDEMFDLLPGRRSEIEALASRSWLIDEFLVRPWTEDRLRVANMRLVENSSDNQNVILHAHCYQKSQPPHPDGRPAGVKATAEMLRAVGYKVDILETGCCGMAGAFGYETEHYDVSMKIGELKLFPEIRQSSGSKVVVAMGTSCRSQIADGTGVNSVHSISLLAKKLPQDI